MENQISGTEIEIGGIPKSWESLTDNEKLEVLREELQNGRYLVSRVVHLEGVLREFMTHSHDADGKVVVPFKERYDYSGNTVMTYDRLR